MCNVPSLGHTLFKKAHHILCAKAIPGRADPLDAVLFLERLEYLLDNGVNDLKRLVGAPLVHVEVRRAVQRDGVPVEKIGHDDEVAVGGKLVGDELGVDKAAADDVGEDEDGVFGGFGRGVGEVGVDCTDAVSISCGFHTEGGE